MRVLIVGATGYVGGRLVPVLLDRGHEVVCAARTPAKLAGRPWIDQVDTVEVDVFDRRSLDAACRGVDVLVYLVHSMDGQGDFLRRDRTAAVNVRDAAAAAGIQRLVYLGGLGAEQDGLSEHLRSRHEVGRVLADGTVPVTELRAAVIIGSGSASFEMLRHLTEVLPVMVTPKWVDTRCQPIAIRDVLDLIAAVLERPQTAGQVLEIGGPDVLTYRDMMRIYAEAAGLRRRVIVPVPVLTPRLSSLWVGLVTPLPTGLARPLVDSLVNEVVVRDDHAASVLPPAALTFRGAVRLALGRIQDLDVATTWAGAEPVPRRSGAPVLPRSRPGTAAASATSQVTPGPAASVTTEVTPGPAASVTTEVTPGPAGRPPADGRASDAVDGDPGGPEDPRPEDPSWAGGTVLTDRRVVSCAAPPEVLFAIVCGIGGERGYHAARLLWEVRGLLDKFVGGYGLRRGRRHPDHLSVGEVVDFWRVAAYDAPRLLRLRAEMKLPGDAWLEFRIEPAGTGSRLVQRARFHPRGLVGRAYWTVLVPFHGLIFPRMARRLAAEAERRAAVAAPPGAVGRS